MNQQTSVKGASVELKRDNDWLERQVRDAVDQLNRRPKGRRGPTFQYDIDNDNDNDNDFVNSYRIR